MKFVLCLTMLGFIVPGGTDIETAQVSVIERDSITLNTDVKVTQDDRITCFYNNNRIGQVKGGHICTDHQCPKQFRDRLTVDHETGSLTITNARMTDSGEYRLLIIGGGRSIDKIFNVTVTSADKDSVSVMEGGSVTLHAEVTSQQDTIRLFFNDVCIAYIRDQSVICTDVECNKGTESFRDRLELDTQTGSLTITNINTTHSGLYRLQIGSSVKTYNIYVHGVSAAERDEMKTKSVKEGESVTLGSRLMKKPNDVMTWSFNDVRITEVTREQSQICTDNECKERFENRLKVNNQTGSLTITNIRATDTGHYKLEITSRTSGMLRRRRSISITSTKNFNVLVIDSGLSSFAIVGICAALLVAVVAAGLMYYWYKERQRQL